MNHDHGMGSKHLLIMVLCCLIPLVAFAAINFLGLPLNTVLYLGLILLCPLGHLFLMKGMMGGQHQHGDLRNPGPVIEGQAIEVKEEQSGRLPAQPAREAQASDGSCH
ncbi:MAG: hypothetical protein HY783_10555 [Chloroflexi bacterium]|nr:hypothetical protein [Chloroflexota bacterium]